MAKKRLKNETARHTKAFAYYVQLGDKRSLRKVAEKFGVRPQTAEQWSQSFNWKQKIRDLDRKTREELERKLENEYFKEKTKLKKMKLRLFVLIDRMTTDKDIDIADAERILRIIKTELGEATSITQGKLKLEDTNPLSDLFGEKWGEDQEATPENSQETNKQK